VAATRRAALFAYEQLGWRV
jgi:hypothetical protein